jgi:hypothetical protein
MLHRSAALLLPVLLVAACDSKPQPPLPPLASNAPKDQLVTAQGDARVHEQMAAQAPYVEQARRTYPDARARYLAGLPPGHAFLYDKNVLGGRPCGLVGRVQA